jgi:hypothetical protein
MTGRRRDVRPARLHGHQPDASAAARWRPFLELVDGVKQHPAFVRELWADNVDEPRQSVRIIVFETLDRARGSRASVTADAPRPGGCRRRARELRILEIHADA